MGRGGGNEEESKPLGRVGSSDSRVIRDLIEQASNRSRGSQPLADEIAQELESWIFNWSRILPNRGRLFLSGRWNNAESISRAVEIRGDYSDDPEGQLVVEAELESPMASRQSRELYRGQSLNSALGFYLRELDSLRDSGYQPEETITSDPLEIAAEIQYLIRTYIA
jgi:hypothetical protein